MTEDTLRRQLVKARSATIAIKALKTLSKLSPIIEWWVDLESDNPESFKNAANAVKAVLEKPLDTVLIAKGEKYPVRVTLALQASNGEFVEQITPTKYEMQATIITTKMPVGRWRIRLSEKEK